MTTLLRKTPLQLWTGRRLWDEAHYGDIEHVQIYGDEYLGVFKLDDDREVVGITDIYDTYTFWSYGLDYFDPSDVMKFTRKKADGRFYFDAGGNGSPVWAEADDLEKAFQELDLL